MSWWRKGRKEAVGIEAHLVDRAKALGGFALKVVAAGLVGFPDRLVVLPGGRIGFLELKRSGKRPRPEQYWWLGRLAALGFNASWASSHAAVDEFLEGLA